MASRSHRVMLSILYTLLLYPFASFLYVYLTCSLLLSTFKRSSRLEVAFESNFTQSCLFILPFIAASVERSLCMSFCWKVYLLTHPAKQQNKLLWLWSLSRTQSTWRSLVVFSGSFMSDNDCLLETWLHVLTSPFLPETPVHRCYPCCFSHTSIITRRLQRTDSKRLILTHSSFLAPTLLLCFLSQLKNAWWCWTHDAADVSFNVLIVAVTINLEHLAQSNHKYV